MSTVMSRFFVIAFFIAYVVLLLGIFWWALASYLKSEYQKWKRRQKRILNTAHLRHINPSAHRPGSKNEVLESK